MLSLLAGKSWRYFPEWILAFPKCATLRSSSWAYQRLQYICENYGNLPSGLWILNICVHKNSLIGHAWPICYQVFAAAQTTHGTCLMLRTPTQDDAHHFRNHLHNVYEWRVLPSNLAYSVDFLGCSFHVGPCITGNQAPSTVVSSQDRYQDPSLGGKGDGGRGERCLVNHRDGSMIMISS